MEARKITGIRIRKEVTFLFGLFLALNFLVFNELLLAQSAYVVSTELSEYGNRTKDQIDAFLTEYDSTKRVLLTEQEKADLEYFRSFIIDPLNGNLKGKLNWEVFKKFDKYFKNLDLIIQDLDKAISETKSEISSLKTKITTVDSQIVMAKGDSEKETKYSKLKNEYKKSKDKLIVLRNKLVIEKKKASDTPRGLSEKLLSEIKSNNMSLLTFSEEVVKSIDANEKAKLTSDFAFTEAAIIQALTVAIVNQTLEGLLSMLMNELLGNKESARYQLVRFCFPKTIDMLSKLQSYSNNSITTIDDAIVLSVKEDLKDLPMNLTDKGHYDIIDSKDLYWLKELSAKREFGYLALGFQAFDKIKSGYHPSELISHLNNYYANNFTGANANADANVSKMLIWADLLASNLTVVDTEGNMKWIEGNQLEAIFDFGDSKNYKSGDYFWGYLYQVSKDNSLRELNVKDKTKRDLIKKHMYDFVTAFKDIYNLTKSISTAKKFLSEDISQYAVHLFTILKATSEIVKLSETPKNDFDNFLNKYNGFQTVAQNALNEQYALILPSIVKLYPDLEYSDMVKQAYRYTSLFAGIASAKSQDELNYVIEKTISSSGGYMRKNNDNALISLNSYPGFFLGGEKVKPYTNFNWGLTVPVGLYIQTQKEFGLFLQFLDLAAPVNYTFSQNVSNLPTNVTFGQLISPGIFSVLNFSDYYPIRLSLGVNLIPELREINNDETNATKQNSFRFGASVSYDLPLWYFWEDDNDQKEDID